MKKGGSSVWFSEDHEKEAKEWQAGADSYEERLAAAELAAEKRENEKIALVAEKMWAVVERKWVEEKVPIKAPKVTPIPEPTTTSNSTVSRSMPAVCPRCREEMVHHPAWAVEYCNNPDCDYPYVLSNLQRRLGITVNDEDKLKTQLEVFGSGRRVGPSILEQLLGELE